jgi:hypothetical protein
MNKYASILSKTLILLLLLMSITTFAQTGFPDLPTDLTPQNYLLKVSTYIFSILIFVSTIVAQFVPVIAKIERKWFIAAAVAGAIGSMFIYLGKTDTTQALWAFVISGGVWEFLKLFNPPKPQTTTPELQPDKGEEPDEYDPSNDDIQDIEATATAEPQSFLSEEMPLTPKKKGRPRKS